MEDWSKHIEFASISDVGMRRSTNQDSVECVLASDEEKWKKRGYLFVVADGMGAHAAGELASKLAADGVTHLYAKYHELSPPEALKRAVVETNAEINRRGQANEEFNNMGTTCSALTLLPYGAVVAHVGDSRVYRVRNGRIDQLTFDHSLVWEMRATGTLPEGPGGENLIPKNVITRSLGPYPDVNVDLEGPFPIEVGDVFLLCSDGLTGEVDDDEIASLLSHLSPERAAKVLVNLANLRGGPDNVTVVIAKVVDPRLATGNKVDEPLTVGGNSEATRPGPIAYSSLGAALLGTLIFVLLENVVFAALFGILAVAIAVYLIMRLSGANSGKKVVGQNLRFGKGPYVKTKAAAGEKLRARMEEIGEEMRNAAREDNLPVDLAEFDQHLNNAIQAIEQGDESAAVNHFCTALNNYMDQLRH